jgi:hypothetical protein
MKSRVSRYAFATTIFAWLSVSIVTAQAAQQKGQFQVSSTEFQNNTTLPLSAIYNYPLNGR